MEALIDFGVVPTIAIYASRVSTEILHFNFIYPNSDYCK